MSNERLSTRQSGNKKLHSTVSSLIRITNAIDEMKISAVVLFDIVKALDTIYHGILVNKPLDIGASPSTVIWFASYLSNRREVVRINS